MDERTSPAVAVRTRITIRYGFHRSEAEGERPCRPLLRKTDVARDKRKKLFRADKVKHAQKLIPVLWVTRHREWFGASRTLVVRHGCGFGSIHLYRGSGALSADFQSERSRRAATCSHCGLWSAPLDNDLIGSLASQNGHGGDLLFSEIDNGTLSTRISMLQTREDNVHTFPSRHINQILLR